jgi:aconitate hydratase
MASENSFDARSELEVGGRTYEIYRLEALQSQYDVARLPFCLKVLLENLLRNEDGVGVRRADVEALATWDANADPSKEIAFTPARVILQDFTGVPCVVDLAAMRDAMADMGGDPSAINPLVPVELVIDHSVQVDAFGSRQAFRINADKEFERNEERYAFLRWGQTAFEGFKAVPPDTGIVHQVNLEYLARVVFDDEGVLYPDTLVGTDSHTTMINGLGVLGWGVGGIEAEAAMLGQPMSMLIPRVVGFKLSGELREGATATDLVLTVTELLRKHGVVGKFVEFHGPGVPSLPLADRATIGNMSPEFGSTCAIFPIDAETLRYLEFSGRPAEQVERVEAYAKAQGLWHDEHSEEPTYSEHLELDLGDVVPSLAGPRRPQDRVTLMESKASFRMALDGFLPEPDECDEPLEETFPASDPTAPQQVKHEPQDHRDEDSGAHTGGVQVADRVSTVTPLTLADGTETELDHGHVVIAAITSCTNTSNPSVMIGAGLLARNAVERGLKPKPWVKTSLAPGSKVVMEYYGKAGLVEPLEALGFHLVGYGCTTCIGNSGPLPEEVSAVVQAEDLAVVSVLSGNRNFEGRINPDVKMNYLASPPLVVAYALAGTMDIDLLDEPLGRDKDGNDVMLNDIWPSSEEVGRVVEEAVRSEMFQASYGEIFEGDERWNSLDVPEGDRFAWDEKSTYVRKPPFFEDLPREPQERADIEGARVLALLGDSVTTDHISPAGSIKKDSPAARYLNEHGVEQPDFNSYGSRRGNHEVMMRGTFANIRLRNLIAGRDDLVGGLTVKLPEGEVMPIYDAAMRYAEDDTPLVVLAGKEYGSGSSRDWAAKGTNLLGVRAVIAESFERIHRSNLVGMGVLPLQFPEGESAESLGLTGEEELTITGIENGDAKEVTVRADDKEFTARVRIDTPKEVDYFKHGGILPFVLRQLLERSR